MKEQTKVLTVIWLLLKLDWGPETIYPEELHLKMKRDVIYPESVALSGPQNLRGKDSGFSVLKTL